MKIAQNISQVSEGGITVKPGQESIHELIIWKVNPFDASVTCSRYQLAFKWSVNFWLQLFSIQRDGKYFNGWNFYLDILQRKLSQQKFHNELVCVLIHCSLCKQTNGWWHFGQSEQRKSSLPFPIQSEKSPDSGFFACDLWKDCMMPSSWKQITEIKGEGMIAGYYCGSSEWPKVTNPIPPQSILLLLSIPIL